MKFERDFKDKKVTTAQPEQTKSEQSKSEQTKSEQTKPEQTKAAQTEPVDIKKETFSILSTVLLTIIVVSVVMLTFFRITPVDGISMMKTLHNADQLITTNIHGELKRGDIVVIRRSDNTALVKRIIAVEGDTIDIDFDLHEVYVNGKTINEPYINEPTEVAIDFDGAQTVPKGHVFVMGDNRNHSDDSRDSEIGMIDKRNIFGKVIFRLFPLDRFGFVKS